MAAVVAHGVAHVAPPPSPDADRVAAFVTAYLADLDADQLAEHDPAVLGALAGAHYELARQRAPGTANVAIRPAPERPGRARRAALLVVAQDMPFVVDSVLAELSHRGIPSRLVAHPILAVQRVDGELRWVTRRDEAATDARGAADAPVEAEAFVHIELERLASGDTADLVHAVERVLDAVRVSVTDWGPMRTAALEAAAELRAERPDAAEEADLLEWLADDRFTFIGVRDTADPGLALGILRPGLATDGPAPDDIPRPPGAGSVAIGKSSVRSPVHRGVLLDVIVVPRRAGERRFVGLWSSSAYTSSVMDIPVVRQKATAVLERSGFGPRSHSGRAVLSILENLPRDEVFQASGDELTELVAPIHQAVNRQSFRVVTRHDPSGRYTSCLVYLPRDRYTPQFVSGMERVLREAFGSAPKRVEVRVGEAPLAQVYAVVPRGEGWTPPEPAALEARLFALTRRFEDDLEEAFAARFGPDAALLLARYGRAFPVSYRDVVPASKAAFDAEVIEALREEGADVAVRLCEPETDPSGSEARGPRLRLFQRGRPAPLSAVLPLVESMGVGVIDEQSFELAPEGCDAVWVHDFGIAWPDGVALDLADVGPRVTESFLRLWHGVTDNDAFNRLVVHAGATWREVGLLRAYARYLQQVGTSFTQATIADVLVEHPDITRRLLELFVLRFDPERDRAAAGIEAERVVREIERAIGGVATLDADRILTTFLALVQATVRTNWFQVQPEGAPPEVVAFKFDPARIPDLPAPRPFAEIWVSSARVEGVHLRGGPVARGGIRWSERRDDFRTEVLGLLKAQMVKNAVIVPVGAKGGFVVRRPPANREALGDEVRACYRLFIQALLDLTDSIEGDHVRHPPRVVRWDGDDPYLVVAADKGTATFSDTANELALQSGFWLGDAFASGGSSGYDHKEMGITARGAWESVIRHFRLLGIDPERDDFTVVGIGDMSGDVFGNGMLQSRHIKLVAAFDHRHVFVDPDPEPARSFEERKRLFERPRSSWDEYDRSVLSEGGGIWPRSAKTVTLSPQARARLGIDDEVLTPDELIQAMLRAPVDLLFNGGIGTYVKASTERHADVGDRSNDGVRVDATSLRCRAVVEGGNLGFTQLARVEYARSGGLIHTDAIDNSAGVDCSDREVNLKILLASPVRDGELDLDGRNALLAAMTDEVAELVLADNRAQTRVLALSREQAVSMIDVHARFIRFLEDLGMLDRELERLPNEKQLAERQAAGEGLTAPELAVLLAYAKLAANAALESVDLADEPLLAGELDRYFPKGVAPFRAHFAHHPLRERIVTTSVVNRVIEQAGITYAFRMQEETGREMADAIKAHLVAAEIFDMETWWERVTQLERAADPAVVAEMRFAIRRVVERGARWILQHRRPPLDLVATATAFGPPVRGLVQAGPELFCGAQRDRIVAAAERFAAAGADAELARTIAVFSVLTGPFDLVEVAAARRCGVERAAAIRFALDERFGIGWLRDRVRDLPRDDLWQTLARAGLRDQLAAHERALTAEVIRWADPVQTAEEATDGWFARNEAAAARYVRALSDLRTNATCDLTTLSVVIRELGNLVLAAAPVP